MISPSSQAFEPRSLTIRCRLRLKPNLLKDVCESGVGAKRIELRGHLEKNQLAITLSPSPMQRIESLVGLPKRNVDKRKVNG
jgi:hypothetical protein